MADLQKFAERVLRSEVSEKDEDQIFILKHDKGGPTKMGITLSTWQGIGYDKDKDGDIDIEDLKLIDKKDYALTLKKFWDRWRADEIKNQSIAEMLVDWMWTSGSHSITIPQKLLGVQADGKVGPKTLAALNSQIPAVFFQKLHNARADFYTAIARKDPKQKKWLNGWINRNNRFKYSPNVDKPLASKAEQ